MVQIIPRTRPTFGEQFASGLVKGGEQGIQFGQQILSKSIENKMAQQAIAEKLAMLDKTDLFKDLPKEYAHLARLAASGAIEPGVATSIAEMLRQGQTQNEFNKYFGDGNEPKADYKAPGMRGAEDLSGGISQGELSPEAGRRGQPPRLSPQSDYESKISGIQKAQEQIRPALKSKDKLIRDTAQASINDLDKQLQDIRNQQKFQNQFFNEERGYHTQYSKPIEEKVTNLRESIPKKESALNLARNAIESGDLSFFTPDKLADSTGLDVFRTAKGAQLITAGKENLLGNMSKVSAKAQNIWFEQRLNSMFPKIGQTDEANLTTQEMLEGELALDRLYLDEFDRLSGQDEEAYGFVKKDIDKRVHSAIKDREKEIFNRTVYRLKDLEEQEQGLSKVKSQVGKNVVKGTPLTLSMAKLYKDKFGENALAVAKKNGYHIPTIEEFRIFNLRPQEFREDLSE